MEQTTWSRLLPEAALSGRVGGFGGRGQAPPPYDASTLFPAKIDRNEVK